MADTANILSQQSPIVVSVASPQAGALFAVFCDVDSGPQPPSYGEPIVAQMLPFGTGIALEYRGATSFIGNEATQWSSSPSIADGLRFLQFRATFVASQLTGARPILTNIVVPHL